MIPTDSLSARYYSSQLGRFLTPDWSDSPSPIPYANLSNPQSLNLYSYVLNNPASIADPDGHYLADDDSDGNCGNPCDVKASPIKLALGGPILLLTPYQIEQLGDFARDLATQILAARSKIGKLSQEHPLVTALVVGLATRGDADAVAEAPPLRVNHSDDTHAGGTARFSLEKVRSVDTESIIDSLKPGSAEPLMVMPDGTIMGGNTRIKVLQERGVEINLLPRVVHH